MANSFPFGAQRGSMAATLLWLKGYHRLWEHVVTAHADRTLLQWVSGWTWQVGYHPLGMQTATLAWQCHQLARLTGARGRHILSRCDVLEVFIGMPGETSGWEEAISPKKQDCQNVAGKGDKGSKSRMGGGTVCGDVINIQDFSSSPYTVGSHSSLPPNPALRLFWLVKCERIWCGFL